MKKCQFYIIIGRNRYVSKDVYKVCININENELNDYDSIKKKLFDFYEEKTGSGLEVNNEIIFLLSDDSYRNAALNIMNHIGLNGRIIVIPSNNNSNVNIANEEKKEEKPKEDNNVIDLNAYREKVNNNNSVVSNSMVNTGADINSNRENNYEYGPKNAIVADDKSAVSKKYSYRPDTMVFYKKDLNPNGEGGTPLTKGGPSLTNGKKSVSVGKVKTLKKTNKRAAFVSMPVLIFVISLLLLIASFVMLFVLD